MQGPSRHHFRRAFLTFLVVASAAGWLYVIYNQNRAKDPLEVVRKHFVFYPDYSHGVWHEEKCTRADGEKCHKVTYTIPVKGCGPVTFDWRVFPTQDAEPTWSFKGASPKLDETRYPLYAMLNEDSRLIDSPALGNPLPETCQLR